MNTADLTGFLDTLSDSITKGNKELYKKIIESSEIKSFTNYEEFYFSIIYPFENLLDGFVKTEISENSNIAFLMINSQFIERNFEGVIVKNEGSACCADKSRTIIKSLIKFYTSGEKISFDYDAKYTYHLPKTVFKTHEHIISFYEGLQSLFYGEPEKYLKALQLIFKK